MHNTVVYPIELYSVIEVSALSFAKKQKKKQTNKKMDSGGCTTVEHNRGNYTTPTIYQKKVEFFLGCLH